MMLTPEIMAYAHNQQGKLSGLRDSTWNFRGYVTYPHSHMRSVCRCTNQLSVNKFQADEMSMTPITMTMVELARYLFVDADMLMIPAFIGQCMECGSVTWYQVSPPYYRVKGNPNLRPY